MERPIYEGRKIANHIESLVMAIRLIKSAGRLSTSSLVLLLMLVVIGASTSAAAVSRSSLTGVYIYRLAENIQWANESKIDNYHIHLIDLNSGGEAALKAASKIKKLHGKPFRVTRSSKATVPASAHLIYVSREFSADYPGIIEQIRGQNVILISDGIPNKRSIMINLFETSERQLGFEINKANIINQNLGINPDIVLLGGTEIDVAKLYKEAQVTLRQQEKQVVELENQRSSLQDKIEEIQQQTMALSHTLAEQQSQLEFQNNRVEEKEQKLMKQHAMIKSQQTLIEGQQGIIAEEQGKFEQLAGKIKEQLALIEQHSLILNAQEENMNQQDGTIKQQEGTIKQQEAILAERLATIASQRNFLYALGAAILLVIMLGIVMFTAYRSKLRANAMLLDQQKQLEETAAEVAIAKDAAETAKDIAESANKAKSIFLANMSHEIRTPLNTITGLVNILQRSESTPAQSERFNNIDD